MVLEIIGLLFSIILGSVGHFLYEWSGYNNIIGFLFSKDESAWEHIKLGITPIILWTIVEFFTFIYNNLFFAKFLSVVTFFITLLILYYSYKKILKKNILFLDILIFYISLAISNIVSIKLLSISNVGILLNVFGFIGICFVIWMYIRFNKYTPDWFIFKEPTKS